MARYLRLLALIVSLSARGLAGGPYLQSVSYPVGVSGEVPSALAVADVNGDGRADLIVLAASRSGASHVSVLLGQPDSTLRPAITYSIPTCPTGVLVADLNGDGKPDLAVINYMNLNTQDDECTPGNTGSITVLLGQGDGTFSAPVSYSLPQGMTTTGEIVAADINKDGKMDLLTGIGNANSTVPASADSLAVLLGNGDGSFQQPLISPLPYSEYFAVGDFDGDGKLDVVSLGSSSGSTSIINTILGNGDGTFRAPLPQNGGAGLSYCNGTSGIPVRPPRVGDFNNDGRLDIVFGSNLFAGNGDGSFQGAASAGAFSQPQPCEVYGDFNGDGKQDVAVVSPFGGTATVTLNFNANPDQSVTYIASANQWPGNFPVPATAVVAGDFAGNGKLSLAVPDPATNAVNLLVGNGNGSFQAQQSYPSGIAPGAIAVGDFNTDGFQDQIIANRGDNTLTELLSRGNGTFRASTMASGGTNPQGVAVGDFNNDGNLDLAVANASSNAVAVFLGDGKGNFTPANPATYTVGNDPRSIQVQDFNGDGKPDLVTVNRLSNTTSVLLGNGDGTFQSAITFSAHPGPTVESAVASSGLSSPREVAVGDLNLDGFPDLVVANAGSNSVSVLLNDKTGHFPTSVSYAAGTAPVSVAIGDLNGDHKPDVLVANSGSNTMSVLMGNGDGTLQAARNIPSGGVTPAWITVLDANRDGRLDAVVANSGSNALSVLFGNGDGTFQSPVNYTVGLNPQYTHVGNFSGGGFLDLSASNNLSNTINVLLNGGATVTQLASSNGSSIFGQSVTFTATVSPANRGSATPIGSVTFADNGSALATIGLNTSGSASYSSSALNAGIHIISATYSGDSHYFQNTTTLTQIVSKAAATLSLSSTSNPSTYGQNVAFAVTASSTAGTPGGTVTLTDGATQLATIALDTSGHGSFSTVALTAGTHNLQASYAGDLNHTGATASLAQTVNKAATATQVASSQNPSAGGQVVTFSVTVTSSGGTPTGTVVLLDSSNNIGSGTLDASGHVSIPVSTLVFGSHSITASYSGDANFLTSTSSVLTQTVLHATMTTVSSPGTITFGQQVPFTATVTSPDPGTPTGAVSFMDGSVALGLATLNGSGQASLTTNLNQPLAAGNHSITAIYAGDSNFVSSTSAIWNQVVSGLNFALTLTHAPQLVHIGQAGTFTATVTNQSGSTVNSISFSFSIQGGRGYFTSGSFTISPGGVLGTCDLSSQPVTCNLGTMNVNDVATITITGVPTLAHTLFATASANATTNTKTNTVPVRFRPFRN